MARLRPSNAPVWRFCAGSVQLQEQFPDLSEDETEAAREGTAAHHVFESLATTGEIIPAGTILPNGIVSTEEMIESADMMMGDITSITPMVLGGLAVQVEQFVQIPRIHPTENAGTPDVSFYDPVALHLYLWDLKFGYGLVEAYENWQLIDYAIGKLDEITGGNGFQDQQITVTMRIVQPRSYHPDGPIREWTVTGSDLRGYANQLEAAAHEALSQNPTCTSGPWCKHCTARANCMTAHNAAMNGVDLNATMSTGIIPPEHLALHRETLIRAKEAIECRLTGIDAQIQANILRGPGVAGLSLENPPGRLKWDKPDAEILALGDLMGVNLGKRALLTPTQSKKLIDEAVIKAYSSRPMGKTRIVNSKTTRAAKVFGINL